MAQSAETYDKSISELKRSKTKMAKPKIRSVNKELNTKSTVERLTLINDEPRFLIGFKQEIENRLQTYTTKLTDFISQFSEETRVIILPEERNAPTEKIDQIFTELETKISSFDSEQGRYNALLAKRNEGRQALEYFKFKHDLQEAPEVPESGIFHAATLFALLFIETAVNSSSFAEVNSMGLVGGFRDAFFFTIINLGMATFAGSLYKYKNHFDPNYRLLGWFSLFLFIVLAVLYNCFVGHYREALTAIDFEAAMANSGKMFFQNPFGISNGSALLLAVLGFMIAVAAFLKSYNYGDSYPGYSRVGRKEQDASQVLMHSREEVSLPRLQSAYEASINEIQLVFNAYDDYVGSWELTLIAKKQLDARINEALPDFRLLLREALLDFMSRLQRAPLRFAVPEIDIEEICGRLQPVHPVRPEDFSEAEAVLNRIQANKSSFAQRKDEEIQNLSSDLGRDISKLRETWEAEDDNAVQAV